MYILYCVRQNRIMASMAQYTFMIAIKKIINIPEY